MYRIETEKQVHWLINRLFRRERSEPIVVIATHRPELDPLHHAQVLSEELTGMADVSLLANSMFTFFASRVVKSHHHPLAEGIQLYEPNPGARRDLVLHRFPCDSLQDWEVVSDQLISLCQVSNRKTPPRLYVPISGHWREDHATVVEVVSRTKIRVALRSGGDATMLAVDLLPGFDAAQLTAPGQQFTGIFQTGDHVRTFSPFPTHDDALARSREVLTNGEVALGSLEAISRRKLTVALHPDVHVAVRRRWLRARAVPSSMGQPVSVEVTWKGSNLSAKLTRKGQRGTSMSLLPGGPPWITSVEPQRVQPAAALPQVANA